MKCIICFLCCYMCYVGFSMCTNCNDKGFCDTYINCYLCDGHGTVSPAYYGQDTGVTRWTSTEYFICGVKFIDLEKKYKKYSFSKCPLCRNSKHNGKIHTIDYCSVCNKDLTKQNIKNFNKIMSLAKKLNVKSDKNNNEFFWTKLMYEMRNNWMFDIKNKDRLLSQGISEEYDIESANYEREKKSD